VASAAKSVVPQELADLPYAAALQPHRGGLSPDGEYDTAHFDQVTLDGPDARNASFLECACTGVSIQDGRLRRAAFNEVWFRDTRLTATDLAEARFLDVTFIAGVAAGVEAYAATLRRVTFQGCKLDSVNFRDAQLTDVTFLDCLLRGVDFSGAALSRTVFAESRLSKVDFTRATMDEVDLRGSELDIVAGPGSLRGAIISPGQLTAIAPALAESLGISVRDE
jgi:uncharacterized protein YjbI with pentapeptide repeats